MTDQPNHFRGRLLVMVAILLGATLLLMGLAPTQEAQGKEKNETAQSQEEKETNAPAKDNNAYKKQKEQVLDEDPQDNEVVAGELLVTYKEEAPEQDKDEAPEQVGGQVEEDFSKMDVQLVSVPEVKDEQDEEAREQVLEQKKEELEQDSNVEAVEYNRVLEPGWEPNDTYYWEPDTSNTTDKRQWGYPKINAPGAWDTTRGSSTVKVAVIDTGIDSNHEDLKGKIAAQWDFANNDGTAEETSDKFNGHGTHVAGTIAATTNNGRGVAGTCPNCKLLVAKYWDETHPGTTDTVLSGINWAVANGAKVINMSLGAPAAYSSAQERAINLAWENGIVLVGTAGNDGTNGVANYPGAYLNVIAVAATNQDDTRSSTSNAGSFVDVAAPGTDIYSTMPGFGSILRRQWYYFSLYDYKSGTSMAAPYVSGLAGLLASRGLSNGQVRHRIESTAVDLGRARWDSEFGHGRIDAKAALAFRRPLLPVEQPSPTEQPQRLE